MKTVVANSRTRSALHALFVLTLAVFALAAGGPAWADPPGRVGRIAETDGNVWVFEDEQGEWVQAQRNRPVTEGDRLSAERGARAEIQIGSGTLRVDGGTDVEFARLDDARVDVRVLGGTAALRVRGSQTVREFALVTEEGRYEPLRPGHYRVDVEDRSSLGETLAGAMRFEAQDSVLEIGEGQRAEFWQEGNVTHYAWANRSDDRFGDWIVRQDREDSRERNRYVSPEMTGAEDLDRYGDWDRHPEYGAVWYPRTVVSGWSPYRYGHWAYVRPWGWTWVDDAPWGFAPFHYGRWVSYGGRWGWCPGQYVARPVYAPALVAWFGGSNVSVGIGVGGGPAVGWVPLAPREIYYPGYYSTPKYVRIVNGTHARWHGPNPRYERPVPTGPIMYTNQGVAGGVTVVPQAVVQNRQPIGAKVVMPVDARTVSSWQADGVRGRQAMPPAPPAARVVATPGAAVPAPPNASPRSANTWSRIAPRVTAGQGDGGRAPSRGAPVSPQSAPQQNVAPATGRVGTPMAPAPQAQVVPQPQREATTPQRPSRSDRDDRDERNGRNGRNGRDDREERGDRRVGVPPSVVQSVPPARPVQPVQPARPVQPVQPAQPPHPQALPAQPRPQQQHRVEPPAVVRPAQPAEVAPPQVRPVPRADDGNGQQRGRGAAERERPEHPQQRNGGQQGADDERAQRVRDPRWNQAR